MAKRLSMETIRVVANSRIRRMLRRRGFWSLLFLAAILFHFAHLFNISAFRGPAALTEEMVWSTYWLVGILFGCLVGWESGAEEPSSNILLFRSGYPLQFVFGSILGAMAVLAIAQVFVLIVSLTFYAGWAQTALSGELLLRHGTVLLVTFFGSSHLMALCLLLRLHIPRSLCPFLIFLFLLIGHFHPQLFPEEELGVVRIVGLLVPDLTTYREETFLGQVDSPSRTPYLGLALGYAALQMAFLGGLTAGGLHWRWSYKS